MDREVVEVIVRWGVTILDVAHLGPRDRYTIGESPRAHLAASGFDCFPIVDRGVVHAPAGVVREGDCFHIGLLTLTITRVQVAPAPLPRPAIERRMPVILLGSLAAHLAVWLIASALADVERIVVVKREEPRFIRVTHARPPEPPPEPQPPPPEPAAQPAPEPEPRPPPPPKPSRAASVGRVDPARLAASLTVDDKAIEKAFERTGEVVNPDDVSDAGFGDKLRWEPPPSVPSRGYVTMTLNVKQCQKGDPQCRLVGPTTSRYVRTFMLDRMPEIRDCYASHGEASGTRILEFTIKGDGTVQNARGDGDGGGCAAKVVETIVFRAQWPRDDTPAYDTRVRWPITFR